MSTHYRVLIVAFGPTVYPVRSAAASTPAQVSNIAKLLFWLTAWDTGCKLDGTHTKRRYRRSWAWKDSFVWVNVLKQQRKRIRQAVCEYMCYPQALKIGCHYALCPPPPGKHSSVRFHLVIEGRDRRSSHVSIVHIKYVLSLAMISIL